MASERDLELLDDYLGNRLSTNEKVAFEKALQKDADLNKEYLLQQRVIEGIKQARALQLKQMLNNVPLSSIPQGGTSPLIQAGAWLFVAGVVGTGLFFYFRNDASEGTPIAKQETLTPAPEEIVSQDASKENIKPGDLGNTELDTKAETEVRTQPTAPTQIAPSDSQKIDDKAITPGARDVFDPNEDSKSSNASSATSDDVKSSAAVTPSIAMETVANSKYHFDYQFKENKLFLYGIFEKNLYEIMEFFSNNKRTMFLYYKDNYYLLNEDDDKVKPLTPIKDEALLKKLKDYRSGRQK
jgi:hypothetical protein